MTEVAIALAGVFVALVTGAGTYFVARRTSSGDIDTSSAAELWQESQNMRRDLRDEVVALRAQIGVLEKDRLDLRESVGVMKAKIADLERETRMMQKLIDQFRAKVLAPIDWDHDAT